MRQNGAMAQDRLDRFVSMWTGSSPVRPAGSDGRLARGVYL